MANFFRKQDGVPKEGLAVIPQEESQEQVGGFSVSPRQWEQFSIVLGQSLRKGRQRFEAVDDAKKSVGSGFQINSRYLTVDLSYPYQSSRGHRWQDLQETIPYRDPRGLRKGDYEHQAVEGYARHLLDEKMQHMQPALASLGQYAQQLRGKTHKDPENARSGITMSLKQLEEDLGDYIDAVEMISHKPHMHSHKDRAANLEEMQLREEVNTFKIEVLDKIDLLLEREDWRDSPWKPHMDDKDETPNDKVANFLDHVLDSLKILDKKANHALDTLGIWMEKYGEKEHLKNRHHKDRLDIDLEHFDEMKHRAMERIKEFEKENDSADEAESQLPHG